MITKTISSRCLLSNNPRVQSPPPSSMPRVTITLRSLILCFFLLEFSYLVRLNFLSLSLIAIITAYYSIKNGSRFPFNLNWSRKKPPIFFIEDPNQEILAKRPRKTNIIGTGTEIHNAGTVYHGEFLHGKRNGHGVFTSPNRSVYEGHWVDGFCDGYGFERLVELGEFKGNFERGMRNGFGSYRFVDGGRYEGEWRYGLRHGIGQQVILSEGSSYAGQFKCDLKHGFGISRFRNGDVYIGEYFADTFLGFGVYQFANGDSYRGSWHEGKMQGFGLYTLKNRGMKSGIWNSGFLITSIPPPAPSIQSSLQATQKVYEKCINLPRIDDQVLKAVWAANDSAQRAKLASCMAIEKLNRTFVATCINELYEIYISVRSLASSVKSKYQVFRKKLSQITFWMRMALVNASKRIAMMILVKAKQIAKSPSVQKAFQVIKKTWRNASTTLRVKLKAMVDQFKRTKPSRKEHDWSHIL